MRFPSEFLKVVFHLLIVVVLGVSPLISVPVWAQVAGATVSGTVTDPSGAIIPEAKVSIANVATGISTVASTNADGLYSAPNLLPGTYAITASAPGMQTAVRQMVTLTVGAQQVLNMTLQVGQVTEQIEVTGAPTVELGSSTLGAVVTSQTVVDLPLNGRDWAQLAALEPGVNMILTQQPSSGAASRANRGVGNQITISGTRPQLNNYRVDGISVVDYAGGSPGSVLGVALGVDAIAEFSVLTSNHSSEYGRTSGGVINAITRSGSNQFHGSSYWFLRNDNLDARNFFDAQVPPFRRNQFGASLGGPIKKNKTFFFADYEGIRQAKGITNVVNVPSPDARNGILHNADGTTTTVVNSAGAPGVDPLVKPFLAFWPLPNAGLIGTGNTGLFVLATNNILAEDFVTTRIDQKFSEKDSLFGTWFWDDGSNDNPDPLNNQVFGNFSFRQMIGLEETHVFSPSLVNSVRVGYSRVSADPNQSLEAINPLVADTSLGSFPGQAAPQISVTGLAPFTGGVQANLATTHWWNSYQIYDDAFLVKGTHSLKFGAAFERMQHNFINTNKPTGSFTFGTLQAFLANQPSTFIGRAPDATFSPRGVRQSLFGGYLQDDWRWRPNLTLNLGVRYEMATVPTEVQGKLTNLPTFTSSTPHLGDPYFDNPTLFNFEPRIGFSWDPFHNGKTAVRAAFGMFDVLPLNYEFYILQYQTAPFAKQLTLSGLAPGSFPKAVLNTIAGETPLSKLQVGSIQTDPSRNYVLIWNLNVQREITPHTTLTVSYVGNHGVHMLDRADDVNIVMPTATPQGYLWPSPRGSGTRLNPSVGQLRGEYWAGDSQYEALSVRLSKRMSSSFQVEGSYTWGKAIDTGSASVIGDPFANSIASLFWFCKTCRRGLSDYNIAHSFVANYIWNLPSLQNWGPIGSRVLGGWQVGGIITAQTGLPFTPRIAGDPLGLNNLDPYAYPNRLTGPGCDSATNPGNPNNYINLSCFAVPNPLTLLGNSGRNSLIGPGLVNYNISLLKNNKISEAFNLQFRAEFFNLLNRANFAVPVANSRLFDQSGNPVGGAGSINQTSTDARDIQFALKLIW